MYNIAVLLSGGVFFVLGEGYYLTTLLVLLGNGAIVKKMVLFICSRIVYFGDWSLKFCFEASPKGRRQSPCRQCLMLDA